ncbi:MAG: regulator [Planctomycetes bacterium]|nr:regulator [Planctomycetota bacterium]
MRILVAWDDPDQADLLGLYLGNEANEIKVCLTAQEFVAQNGPGRWDVVLMSLTFPKTADDGFNYFQLQQEMMPGVPVVMACRQSEMLSLPRFMTKGLRFYIVRDDNGDFIFLVMSTLESAVQAARAEEAKKLTALLRDEMDGVRRMQESIIPKGLVPPPGYAITARYEPAQVQVVGEMPVVMAGGDYYDLFLPEKNQLALMVGDASGHGLKACMSIMAMHTLIRMFSGARYRETARFVAEINQRLCDNSIVQSGGGFITLFYTAIDTASHEMHWTSAGHPLALLQNMATNEVLPIGTDAETGLPLGIYPDVEYNSGSVPIPPGSRILIYSDGLTDALPPQSAVNAGTAYGTQGVVTSLQESRSLDLEKALDYLFQKTSDYTGGYGRHDDTSVVLLERFAT